MFLNLKCRLRYSWPCDPDFLITVLLVKDEVEHLKCIVSYLVIMHTVLAKASYFDKTNVLQSYLGYLARDAGFGMLPNRLGSLWTNIS